MKKTITLTKMLTLALLLVTFTTVSAASGGGKKCKSKCCKDKKIKEVVVAMAELEKAMNKLETEFRTVTALAVTTEMNQSLQKLKTIAYRPTLMVAYAPVTTTTATTVEAKYKINFSNINAEMDKEQERMTAAPDMSQKIDFSNLAKEMNDAQEKMTRLDENI